MHECVHLSVYMVLVNLKWGLFSFGSSVFILFIFFNFILCYFIFSFLYYLLSFLRRLFFFLMGNRERKRGVDVGKWGDRKM